MQLGIADIKIAVVTLLLIETACTKAPVPVAIGYRRLRLLRKRCPIL